MDNIWCFFSYYNGPDQTARLEAWWFNKPSFEVLKKLDLLEGVSDKEINDILNGKQVWCDIWCYYLKEVEEGKGE